MNYSTLKKTVVLSFVSLMAVGMAKAQTTSADSSKTSTGTGTAKVFGGASQYNTFSIGINVGATSPSVFTGGTNPFSKPKADLGFGLSLRDQLSHAFSLQLDAHGGSLKGDDGGGTTKDLQSGVLYSSFTTKFWSGSLSGVINVGNVSFLHRANAINFYVSGGAGLAFYTPDPIDVNGVDHKYPNTVKELIIPVGAGVKFKLSDQFDLNVGYTENFVDGINVSGVHAAWPRAVENKYSYGYAGLEYTFGPKSKPSLEWANPVAMMYDELYDAALRQEVEALKGRVANVETAVNGLKKDSDGDGVSDQFDKCPNTPAGTAVDGSGCPLPAPIDTSLFMRKGQMSGTGMAAAYSNIQFEFDSSVLKTSSYPVLDATSADLRSSGASAELDGYASSEGTAAHNMRLSKDRANSVKTYLVNSGVPAKKLKVKGFGETHPVADNSTEAGRILNRRVEFHKK
ncbi:OmpA family protein [Mucilaginibacter sp.]|uniref:OmpA family protein n=1 Tax=Mucilaginibacter sp. TaxID=1882438 RepID=UPI00284651B8|nr:OmpA family protein [Mucilaginibacter sp.]MDR3693110.1 OmpA family protein [Mucilaginibacter sp.]